MINSDFDTIIRNDNNFSNKKKSWVGIVITIIILIIIGVGGIIGYNYYSKYKSNIPKIKFFEYIDDTNINNIADTTILEMLGQKIIDSSFSINNKLSFESQDENLKLPIIDINYNKNSNNQVNGDFIINKNEENELIKFSWLADEENIGIKSDDIVVKFVGSKKENLIDLLSKMYSNSNTNSQIELDLSNTQQIENIPEDFFNKYKDIINNNLTEDKFTIEENILLTQNEASMQTTLYELKISKDEFLQLMTQIKDQLVLDESLINCYITGNQENQNNNYLDILRLLNGNKIDCTLEQAIELIETNFNNLYSKILENEKFDYLYIDIYVNNETVVKKSIKIGELFEVYFENEKKSDNENFAKFTLIYKDEENKNNAIIFSTNRLDNNVSTILDCELSMTENGTINKRITINNTLEGNENSSNLTNKFVISYSNENKKITANLDTNIKFGYEEELESLNQDNCLFLDELDEQTLADVIGQITVQIEEVIKSKTQEFLEGNLEVENENVFEELVDMDGQTDNDKKKEAQDKLIAAISEEMRIAAQEEREYALADLQNLQVDGSTVSVMVGENMAIVAIDGYTFYIDPNFVLTTE